MIDAAWRQASCLTQRAASRRPEKSVDVSVAFHWLGPFRRAGPPRLKVRQDARSSCHDDSVLRGKKDFPKNNFC